MSSEKRLFLCLILTIGAVYGTRMVMVQTGLIVPPKPIPPAVAKGDPDGKGHREGEGPG